MAVFKCKICGGTLEINAGETVATCEYCGTKQTLPKLDDEKKANLFDRANHFRRNNDFDKAMGIYEQILNEDTEDAESYWSIVLCRYGIEYVEDPSSHKRVPTVNRAQFTSVFDDEDYKSAIKYADSYQKSIYEQEARNINEIQKGILAISQKEEPFDVFICYKETDNNGRRTQDSVLATELYNELTREGFKVFFSRITLEDKLGVAYEPYIFAALHSAKVMVALGTKPEHFNAVWVKNEWSRYLSLIKNGANKILIPAYRNMDPYDLPEEFSHLQAQDMSKLGFMQDLIRGIKKIVLIDTASDVNNIISTKSTYDINTEPLLRRMFMFLEDKDWKSANAYCEKILDREPENAYAYLGKLLAEFCVTSCEELANCENNFYASNNFQKSMRFADNKLKEALNDARYNYAKKIMESANTENVYKEVSRLFKDIGDYKDAIILSHNCLEKAEKARKNFVFENGILKMKGDDISNYEEALDLFKSISGWKDADEKACTCERIIEAIKANDEAKRIEKEREKKIIEIENEEEVRKKRKKRFIITLYIFAIVIFIIICNAFLIPNYKYNEAVALMESGLDNEAYTLLIELGKYKDSAHKAEIIEKNIFNLFLEEHKNVKIGDYISFGTYEQDSNFSNGEEDIEWIVLEKQDEYLLLISKYALDSEPFDTYHTNVTWETSTLRMWVNNDFYNSAFSKIEQTMIGTRAYNTYAFSIGDALMYDNVFLLSKTRMNKYFDFDSIKKCKPTEYAKISGLPIDSEGNCSWWMNFDSILGNFPRIISTKGLIQECDTAINNAIRPCIFIDLSS